MYKLRNLIQEFKNKIILNLPELELKPEKIQSLCGHNGAGKTTLLEILAFLTPPKHGEVYFQNQKITWQSSQLNQLRRQVVMVDQTPIMFCGTVWDNLAFGLKARNLDVKTQQQKIEEVLALFELDHLAKNQAPKLSGGECKRVALGRAFILKPQVLILDEPTANADTKSIEIIEKNILNLSQHTHIILTTHDPAQNLRLTQHSTWLSQGELIR